ncbi:MAG: hypothetical protein U5Q44_15810 [Dehalococcoidia bacterium]|nr:hypothetical protein [Dehalococcoidia bacterium]
MGWLENGWADIQFRRPVYPGDELQINVDDQGVLQMTKSDGEVCVRGAVGLGEAAFLSEFALPRRVEAVPPADPPVPLVPDNAPVGQDPPPMQLPYHEPEAREYLQEKQRDLEPPWLGDDARIHPGWLAARMTPLLHHTYSYAPAIHARSQIQHLAPARVGQDITVAGHFVDTYERKGNHYGVVDGLILGDDGTHLARIRHTTIYSVARPG